MVDQRYNYTFQLMGYLMSGFIEGTCRSQATLFPDRLDDYITEENDIRVIDAFIDSLDLSNLGFKTVPADTGRPAYHPWFCQVNQRWQIGARL